MALCFVVPYAVKTSCITCTVVTSADELPTSDGGLSSDIIVTIGVLSAFLSGLLVVLVAVILVLVFYHRKKNFKVDHVGNL